MYALQFNPDGTEDTLFNVGEPGVFLHGQRRIVEVEIIETKNEFVDGVFEITANVKGKVLGTGKLFVNIAGYDGVRPEIDFDVVDKKTVNVFVWIVKNRE